MTRPMLGPLEHDVRAIPHRAPHEAFSVIPCALCIGEMYPEAFTKRLTDAECAAHRWQAASTLGLALYAPAEVLGVDIPEDGNMYSWERPDAEPLNRAYDAWQRFAAHPHALEEA